MACTICKQADVTDSEQYYDHFQRFYSRYLLDDPPENPQNHQYRYQSATSEGETRLFTLDPGDKYDLLSGSLEKVRIDEPPDYAALSYVWGHKRNRVVLVDGEEFQVTDSLWYALWHIRSAAESITIWIDALCINQDDVQERNTTVPHMKDIYENAQEVIAWLGPEAGGGTDALAGISEIHSQFEKLVDKFGTHEAAFSHMLENNDWWAERADNPYVRLKTWVNINRLLTSRTWFHRVWIMQEGTTPIKTTFHLCHCKTSADSVYEVFRLLQRVPLGQFPRSFLNEPSHFQQIDALTTFAQERAQRRVDLGRKGKSTKGSDPLLVDTLATLRGHRASDPHDKIYAALGFAKNLPYPVKVDYNKSLAETLRDAAFACLSQDSDPLRLLGHAGMWASGHLPATWMPDWVTETRWTPLPKDHTTGPLKGTSLFNASAWQHAIWKDPAYNQKPCVIGDTLRVPGVIVDYVRSTFVEHGQPKNMEYLERLWKLPNMEDFYAPTNEPMESAYLRTLVADLAMKDGGILGRGGSMYWRDRL
ncbi:HET-domain-containing protein [Polyplosphaeria fusca]|uniref:HET-domain-containing protein n=1 Tax=Polyplosphaeria fusca TaxID=682080 RepID=A0A9P4V1Z7_9PLEO|nr:HET-domain-containing protein [Polyplosphaeria fusca]